MFYFSAFLSTDFNFLVWSSVHFCPILQTIALSLHLAPSWSLGAAGLSNRICLIVYYSLIHICGPPSSSSQPRSTLMSLCRENNELLAVAQPRLHWTRQDGVWRRSRRPISVTTEVMASDSEIIPLLFHLASSVHNAPCTWRQFDETLNFCWDEHDGKPKMWVNKNSGLIVKTFKAPVWRHCRFDPNKQSRDSSSDLGPVNPESRRRLNLLVSPSISPFHALIQPSASVSAVLLCFPCWSSRLRGLMEECPDESSSDRTIRSSRVWTSLNSALSLLI